MCRQIGYSETVASTFRKTHMTPETLNLHAVVATENAVAASPFELPHCAHECEASSPHLAHPFDTDAMRSDDNQDDTTNVLEAESELELEADETGIEPDEAWFLDAAELPNMSPEAMSAFEHDIKMWNLDSSIQNGDFGYGSLPAAKILAIQDKVKNIGKDRLGNLKDSPDVYERLLEGVFRSNRDGRLWSWTGHQWRVVDDYDAQSNTAKLIKNTKGSLRDLTKVIAVNKLITALCDRIPDAVPGISVLNGLLNQTQNGTWELGYTRPEDGQRYCLPFEYDPKAKCDLWESFLSDVQPNQQSREYLRDILGYILLGEQRPRAEAFFVFQGTGSNGKSVCLEIFKELVGEENYATLAMNQFTGRNLEALVGKLANFGSETERSEKMETSIFKQAVSGEEVLAEPKYRAHYHFRNQAALVFAVNEMPIVDERTDGIWRRMKLVPWNVTIPAEKRDPYLISKLKNELAGILNWGLIGATRVAQRGGLQDPVDVTAAVQRMRTESNTVATFIDECAVQGPDAKISKSDAYEAYNRWCKAGNFKPISRTNFGREVTRICKLSKSGSNSGGKVPTNYHDINGLLVGDRYDAYPFFIPSGYIPRYEHGAVVAYPSVGIVR